MGSFLDKPKAEKNTEEGEGCGLRFGVSAMQGWRGNMEDAHTARIGLPDLPDWSFFGVYDGHAGKDVSHKVSESLVQYIMQTECFKDPSDTDTVCKGIRQGFLDLDKAIAEMQQIEAKDHSGSTVVVVIISPTHFYFANCGDSRALLCSSNSVKFATLDHKPSNKEEKERIEKAGGNVLLSRVNGSLAVSRALGDYAFKHLTELAQTAQMVSPEPDVTAIERIHEEDQYILLACDGIWDVVTNEGAVEYLHSRLRETANLPDIVSNLLDYCLYKDSKDNMTAILVTLMGAPTVDDEAVATAKALDVRARKEIEDKINDIVKNSDPLDDLDELSVTQSLERHLSEDLFLHSRRKHIAECLEKALAIKDATAAQKEAEATSAAASSAPAADAEASAGDASAPTTTSEASAPAAAAKDE